MQAFIVSLPIGITQHTMFIILDLQLVMSGGVEAEACDLQLVLLLIHCVQSLLELNGIIYHLIGC